MNELSPSDPEYTKVLSSYYDLMFKMVHEIYVTLTGHRNIIVNLL